MHYNSKQFIRTESHPKYIELQILDFISRLNKAIDNYPYRNKNEKYPYKIKDYLHSSLGRSLILDQSINRPANVVKDFGIVLDNFFKLHPDISQNPNNWQDLRVKYEREIINDYGVNRKMVDASLRFRKSKNILDKKEAV